MPVASCQLPVAGGCQDKFGVPYLTKKYLLIILLAILNEVFKHIYISG
jgi:hypothetical protein